MIQRKLQCRFVFQISRQNKYEKCLKVLPTVLKALKLDA